MAIDTIKFKRGVKSKLNNLSYGEPAYISDENELYIGTEDGVEKITRNKEVAELSSQLEQNMNEINEQFNAIANLRTPIRYGKINLPSDFIPVDFELYRKLDGKIYHNIDVDKRWRNNNIQETIYVDMETGSNLTGDGSEENPFQTPAKAFQVASSSLNSNIKIILNSDIFLRDEFFINNNTYSIFNDKNIVITTKDNKKIPFVNGDSTGRYSRKLTGDKLAILPNWTLESGNVYKTTRPNTYSVIDTTYRNCFNGNILKMIKVSSVAECENTKGSYYIDGETVYVHTFDNRVADENLVCMFLWTAQKLLFRLNNSSLYIENIEFYNYDGVNIRGDNSSHFIFNNCDFGETGSTNSLNVLLVGKVYLLNCTAHDSLMDGFNYHYTKGIDNRNCLVFEYNCQGYSNGNELGGTGNNFTTAHEGISTLRVNCFGEYSQGVTCADVNGCYSLLYDCQMMNSRLPSTDKRSASYQFTTDSGVQPAKAKLVNCSGISARKSIISDPATSLILESWNEDLNLIERNTIL